LDREAKNINCVESTVALDVLNWPRSMDADCATSPFSFKRIGAGSTNRILQAWARCPILTDPDLDLIF